MGYAKEWLMFQKRNAGKRLGKATPNKITLDPKKKTKMPNNLRMEISELNRILWFVAFSCINDFRRVSTGDF